MGHKIQDFEMSAGKARPRTKLVQQLDAFPCVCNTHTYTHLCIYTQLNDASVSSTHGTKCSGSNSWQW